MKTITIHSYVAHNCAKIPFHYRPPFDKWLTIRKCYDGISEASESLIEVPGIVKVQPIQAFSLLKLLVAKVAK